MKPTVIVLDDFLEDPDRARSEALLQSYQESPYYKGFRSVGSFWWMETDRKIRDALKRSQIDYVGSSFQYHYSVAGTPEVYHADPNPPLGEWAGVLYLKPNAPLESGTSLFRHRSSGRDAGDPSHYASLPGPFCYLDPTEFEETDFVGNRYNRLVLFRSDRIHSMRRPFGSAVHNARLTQLFFFR